MNSRRLTILASGLLLLSAAGCSCGPGTEADGGSDDSGTHDGGNDGGLDGGHDAGVDGGEDGGQDAGPDAGTDAGTDGGCVAASLTARIEVGTTVGADGKLYIAGGLAGASSTSHVTPLVEALDPLTGDLYIGSMPTARSSPLAAAGPDGKIYVAGGTDDLGNALDTVEVLDPTTGGWSTLAPMPSPSPAASGGFIGSQLVVLTWLATSQVLQIYDLTTQSWNSVPVPATGQGAPGVASFNGTFSILVPPNVSAASLPDGGLTYATFHPADGGWSFSPPSPPATSGGGLTGYGAGVASGDSILYVMGGIFPGGDYAATLQSYSTASGVWTNLPSMPTPRGELAAASVLGEIYAIDGQSFGGALGLIEAYRPSTKSWRTVNLACQFGSLDAGTPGCVTTPPPVDAGTCAGSLTQSQGPLPVSGGAFQDLNSNILLLRLEQDCGFICSDPLALCGSYQWLDLVVIAPAIIPGTYVVDELTAPNAMAAEADGGMSAALLTYQESLGQSNFNVAVGAVKGGTVTLSAISATQVSGSYNLLMPEVADGGEVFTDAGCPSGHPTCPLMVQHAGSFTLPAASCPLQTTLPPL